MLTLNDIVGRELIASKRLVAKRLPSQSERTLFTINANQSAGMVFSFIKKDQTLGGPQIIPLEDKYYMYLMFKALDGTFYYIGYDRNSFNLSLAYQQLVEEQKSNWEKWFESISEGSNKAGKRIVTIALATAAAIIVPRILKRR